MQVPGPQQAVQQQLLPEPGSMQHVEPSQGTWPADTALCGSLSVPQMHHQASTGLLQDDSSWASTVSGDDAYMAPPSMYGSGVAGAARESNQASLAAAYQLLAQQQARQQAQQQQEMLQVQQQQDMLQARKQQEELQLLLAQLGNSSAPTSLPAPASQVVATGDLAAANARLLAQLQCLSGAQPPAWDVATRRASMQLLPVGGVEQQPPRIATRRTSMQLLPASTAEALLREDCLSSGPSPLQLQAHPMVTDADDLNAAALEATLEATLQQLWVKEDMVKEDMARRRAASRSTSTSTLLSSTASPLTAAAPGSAVAATAFTSALYQPTQDSASAGMGGAGNSRYSDIQAALLPNPAACVRGGLLPSAMNSTDGFCRQECSSVLTAPVSVPVLAAAEVVSCVEPQHVSWGEVGVRHHSLADWLQQQPGSYGQDCNTGAGGQGLSTPEAVLQEELQAAGCTRGRVGCTSTTHAGDAALNVRRRVGCRAVGY